MADKPKWCCSDIAEAAKDGVIKRDLHLSTCIITKDDCRVPIPFCPWCRAEQPKTLATSPAMLYRP